MLLRRRSLVVAAGSVLGVCALFAQKPFRELPAWEYSGYELPSDFKVPGEWTFARMMYPTSREWIDWQSDARAMFDWRYGHTNWSIDYPRSDRHIAMAIRRLTRVETRSVEQLINLDEDEDGYNYPWLYAVEMGHAAPTDLQVQRFREYLLRGGFFMCDDFHGTTEWRVFTTFMSRVFPDKQFVDIPANDPIFHSVYNLDSKYQVPGAQFIRSRSVCEKCDEGGAEPHWRGIYDDHQRLMVAACHNMDLGDSWEHADDPEYPQQYSQLGLRIGVNYVVYGMTH